LNVIATNVQASLRKEFGDAKFYLLVDEARDESKREHMAIFVDTSGYIREWFFELVHLVIQPLQLLRKNFVLFYIITNWMFKIFADKDTMHYRKIQSYRDRILCRVYI
jgi:hypothetical protein